MADYHMPAEEGRGCGLHPGSVATVGAFFTSYGPSGPDGLAVDERGRVIVANPGLGVAWLLGPTAEPEIVLRNCAGRSLTNVAFGGPQRKTLYCTESISGSVLQAELEVTGLQLHRPG
jgi:gluconolactonase